MINKIKSSFKLFFYNHIFIVLAVLLLVGAFYLLKEYTFEKFSVQAQTYSSLPLFSQESGANNKTLALTYTDIYNGPGNLDRYIR